MSRWQRVSQFVDVATWCLQQLRGPKASSTKLPIELLKDVEGLGSAGSIVKVNHGYARNFLIPEQAAIIRRGKQSGSVDDSSRISSTGGVTLNNQTNISSHAEGSRSPLSTMNDEDTQRIQQEQYRRRLENIVKKLTTQTLTMKRKVNDKGELDKHVSAADVADAVARQMQIEIVPDLVDLGGEELKSVGEYELPLKLILANGERAKLDVTIVST